MAIIKAKVIDDMHLELEKGIRTKSGEVFVRIIEKKPIRDYEREFFVKIAGIDK